ncbi:MAG: glycosyltransferase family 4 protein [Bacteroidales bacterium]|nr:glycosyltransferase family 4 protein [Bacteroidales bacterium]
MMIAVNTRLLLKDRLEGIGWFSYEALKRITSQHPEHTFLFLFDRPYDPGFIFSDNIIPLVVAPRTRHPLLWYTWFEWSLPRVLKKHRASLFFSPDGYMPLHLEIPTVIAIHDINFQHRPADLPPSSRFYYRKYFPLFASQSDRIITVSEYSRKDIVDSYGVSPDKIDVVYNGVNQVFSPLEQEVINRVRNEYTGGLPYYIFVGSFHPRKNLARLMKAFDLFRDQSPGAYKLVIVGEKMFMTGDIDKTYAKLKHKGDIVFTGRLSPEKLRDVMGAASGLTFVPLFEGFGIPLLEAMNCDIPILTSNVTSLPEIAGKSAIYCDPLDIQDISKGMLSLATQPDLQKALVSEGRIIRASFSWDLTAEKVWKSLLKIIPA